MEYTVKTSTAVNANGSWKDWFRQTIMTSQLDNIYVFNNVEKKKSPEFGRLKLRNRRKGNTPVQKFVASTRIAQDDGSAKPNHNRNKADTNRTPNLRNARRT